MENVLLTAELDFTHLWAIVLLVIDLVEIVKLFQPNALVALQDISNLELTVLPDARLVNIWMLQASNVYLATLVVPLVQHKSSVLHAQILVFNLPRDNAYSAFSHAQLAQATVYVLHVWVDTLYPVVVASKFAQVDQELLMVFAHVQAEFS